ncbi:MAG: DMT family transporter [Actinomycetota bacterium]|nr:DMT family transporter [Actinomycetota bacterium]
MSALLALTSSGLWGTADFYGGLLSRRLRTLAVIVVSQAFALLGIAVVVLVGAVAAGAPPVGSYLWYGVGCGLIGPVALAAFYRALALGPMGLVAPIAATGVSVPVLVGLLGGERLLPAHVAGIAVAVTGIVLASGPELRGRQGGGPGLLLAGVAALGFGCVFVLIAAGAETSVPMTLLTQRATNLVVGLAALFAVRQRLGLQRGDLRLLAFVGLADMAANGTYGLASQAGLLTVSAVLASLYPVVTALLARQLLGERLRRVQLVGVGAALAGVLLLAGAG